jgi:histidine triad (HIT) family protein
MKNENCIFCKIVANEIPSYKVYEDENLLAFLTIRPHKKGHTIMVPKNHSEDIVEMSEADFDKLFNAGKKLAEKMKSIFGTPRVSLFTMGFGVNHTHLHILPIEKETDLNTDMAYDAMQEELQEVQKLLTAN